MTNYSFPKAIQWSTNGCKVLDQTRLPSELVYVECETVDSLVDSIQRLAIRGAPVLGVAGAFGVWLCAKEALTHPVGKRSAVFDERVRKLREVRPTAVNLAWGVDEVIRVLPSTGIDDRSLGILKAAAEKIFSDDVDCNERMAVHGARLFAKGVNAITICNTGDLCTAAGGTAFGVLREAYRQGNVAHVYALETRPLLQGLRLTAWELENNNIPFTMICDSAAAHVFAEKKIGAVIAGADRIAANGDAANKVGTYMLAVLAKYHGVPFYIAAPRSTFDLKTPTGRFIKIEERSSQEIFDALGPNQPQRPYPTFSPAFDVTPHSLITAIVTEAGVLEHPNEERMKQFFQENF